MKKSMIALLSVATMGVQLYAGGDIAAPVYEPAPVEPQPVAKTLDPVYYVGGGLAVSGLSRDCPCSSKERLKDMTYGVALRAGADVVDYLGIELRYLQTFMEKDFSDMVHYGIYLKPYYPVTNTATLYALLGLRKYEYIHQLDSLNFN